MNSDEDLLQQPETIQQKPTGSFRFAFTILTWLVPLLLGLFPPVAWYFLWKEKRRHRFFPIFLYIYGSLILGSTSLYVFLLHPQIAKILATSSQSSPLDSPIGLVFMLLLTIYAVTQIALGKFMKKAFQKYSSLPTRWLWGTALIFILDTIFFIFILPAIVLAWLLQGLYGLSAPF